MATRKRKGLSKKLRFEVFKRDSFTCQYCGAKAPDVVLHADHIVPVIRGGRDVADNLVTSCRDCNLGKHTRPAEAESVTPDEAEAELDHVMRLCRSYGVSGLDFDKVLFTVFGSRDRARRLAAAVEVLTSAEEDEL